MTRPLTSPLAGGLSNSGEGRKFATVRVTISGMDVQYPPGTSLCTNGGTNGVNWGTFGSITDADVDSVIATMVANGVKIVRLVGWSRWFGDYNGSPGSDSRDDNCYASFNPENRRQLLEFADKLAAAHIWYVVCGESDCGQSGFQDNPTKTYCNAQIKAGETPCTMGPGGVWTVVGGTWTDALGYNFFTSPVLFNLFRARWKLLAEDFRGRDYCFAYELLSEPLPGTVSNVDTYDTTWNPRLNNFFRVLIADIDSIDGRTPYILGGRGGYNLNSEMGEIAALLITDPNGGANLQGRVMLTWDQLSSGASIPSNYAQASRCQYAVGLGFPAFMNQLGTKDSDDPSPYSGLKATWRVLKAYGVISTIWQHRDNLNTDASGYAFEWFNGSGYTTKPSKYAVLNTLCTETLTSLEAAAIAAATAEGAMLFYVKADLSNVWQDTGGGRTTPGVIGQPVGQFDPVVGSNATLNFIAATTARPTLAQSAHAGLVDNRPVLLFDGSTSIMNGSATFFSSGSQVTVIAAGIPGGNTLQDFLYCGSSTTPKWPRLSSTSGNVGQATYQSDTTTNQVTGTITSSHFPMVLTTTRDASANKIQLINGLADGSTNTTADGTIASLNRLRMGGTAGNTANFSGPIALICVKVGTMSAANMQAIERFGACLVGAGYQV